jgi:hypothetical protein
MSRLSTPSSGAGRCLDAPGVTARLALLALALASAGALAQPSQDPRQRDEPNARIAPKRLTPAPPRPAVPAPAPTPQAGFDPRGGCGLKAGCGTGPVQINGGPTGSPMVMGPAAPAGRIQGNYSLPDACKIECRKPKAQVSAACRPSCP